MRQIADPDTMLPDKHSEVEQAFRALLIDLRIQLSGQTAADAGYAHPEPITVERLNRLSRLLNTLGECRDDSYRIKY
jgi:hypothetical protein